MLSGDLPTGTVEPPDRRTDEIADTSDDEDVLRRELRRRERERRELVVRYERLLDERDERIAELRSEESTQTLRRRLGDLLNRL
jgi:hypothetical protein